MCQQRTSPIDLSLKGKKCASALKFRRDLVPVWVKNPTSRRISPQGSAPQPKFSLRLSKRSSTRCETLARDQLFGLSVRAAGYRDGQPTHEQNVVRVVYLFFSSGLDLFVGDFQLNQSCCAVSISFVGTAGSQREVSDGLMHPQIETGTRHSHRQVNVKLKTVADGISGHTHAILPLGFALPDQVQKFPPMDF